MTTGTLSLEHATLFDQRTGAGALKVVYVITRSDSIGGGHIHIRDLALALRARGGEPYVLVGQEGPFTDELRRCGIPFRSLRHLVRPIHPWHDAAALFELWGALRKIRPDLVSTHSAKAGWLVPMVATVLGIPSLQTTHGWSFTTGVPRVAAWCYSFIERIGVLFADRVIGVCEYDRQLALRFHVAPAAKVLTVHNGMPDVGAALQAAPARSPARLLMVARFEAQKDHGTLLRALARLRGKSWQLDLIGDGPQRADTLELARDLGIADRVHFLGARTDVAEQLAQSQVFLLISHWEGFPRSILEAMRAGLPVLASDVGGVSESVVEGITGFLIPPDDVDTLQARLELVLEFPGLRTHLGGAGRARYESQFTFDHMFERTTAVYSELLQRKPKFRPVLAVPQRASTT
jgi:glycosyltransferase involved in cell wall biosynthesis